MINHRCKTVLAAAVALLAACAPFANASISTYGDDDVLATEDVVVRGTITSVTHEQIDAKEFNSTISTGLLSFVVIRLDVGEVLRGVPMDGDVNVYVGNNGTNPSWISDLLVPLQPGNEVIVTGQLKQFRGVAISFRGTLVRKGEGWREYGKGEWKEPVALSNVKARVESVGIPSVTKRSELVVRGKVVEVEQGNVPLYRVLVEQRLKGNAPDTVVVTSRVPGANETGLMIPFSLEAGESWYLFLSPRVLPEFPNRALYSATAGRWSAYLIRDNKLLERRTVPSPHSVRSVQQEVRANSSK